MADTGETNAGMDMQAHEATYHLFNLILKIGIVATALITALVIFLIAG